MQSPSVIVRVPAVPLCVYCPDHPSHPKEPNSSIELRLYRKTQMKER